MENESIEQRIARENEERRKVADSRDLKRQAATGSRYVNTARKEDAQSRFKELLSPSVSPVRSSARGGDPVGGNGVDCYVYKDGELKVVKFILAQ